MAGRGIVILTMGLLAVVLLVMPNAVAKFTGQHNFIAGANVSCGTCHKTEQSELQSGTAHENMTCQECHIPNLGNLQNPYGSGTASYHAAALVECLLCHGQYNGSTTREGTTIPSANVTYEFENSKIEAHKPFYMKAKNDSESDNQLMGANEACVACHTHAANVTVSHPTQYLNITAYYTGCTGGANCYSGWTINFSINRP